MGEVTWKTLRRTGRLERTTFAGLWPVALVVGVVLALLGVGSAEAQRPAGLIKHLPAATQPAIPDSVLSGRIGTSQGGLATDAAGNLYLGVRSFDTSTAQVVVFDRDGRYLRDWRGPAGSGKMPIAVGPDGLVYLAHNGAALVSVHTAEGALVRTLGSPVGGIIEDLEVDATGQVWVSASNVSGGDTILRLSPAGAQSAAIVPFPYPAFGSPAGNYLRGLAVAPDGTVWVATTSNAPPGRRGLLHLDASGSLLGTLDLDLALDAGAEPEDVDFANGRLYVAGSSRLVAALVVLSPEGRRLDLIAGQGERADFAGRAVAVADTDVYLHATGSSATAQSGGARFAQLGSGATYRYQGRSVPFPRPGDSQGFTGGSGCLSSAQNDLLVPLVTVQGGGAGCTIFFTNRRNPCPAPNRVPVGGGLYVGGGRSRDGVLFTFPGTAGRWAQVVLPDGTYSSGSVVVDFICADPSGANAVSVLEYKGEIDLIDPSGNVLDARTGRPVEAATVRLQTALVRRGPFRTPGVSGYDPQVNPQITGRDGSFGWVVAPGFWRLRITAFGYRPLTSAVYEVPPEVTGLKLAMRQNPAQQRRLIDVRMGRVGTVRLGARLAAGRRVAGLRLRVVGGRVRGISVRSGRFRTIHGVRVGSSLSQLSAAFPSPRLLSGGRVPRTYRFARATFRLSARGRVTAITLGR